jgi:PhzF family phenazine biosynthesis protein
MYQVDAFTSRLFGGNPAAVCPLETWLPDALMQSIAAENNLSETAFFVPEDGRFRLRWFTPVAEVDLCGHATLATAHVICRHLEPGRSSVEFDTRSGRLTVVEDGDRLIMDLPSYPPAPADPPDGLVEALGSTPAAVLKAHYLMAVYDQEEEVRNLEPKLDQLVARGVDEVMVTAPGQACDFVSRFFGPGFGIPEDPVTGSAHCALVPYWAARLSKTRLFARQISARGGELQCELRGDRVMLAGAAVTFLEGTITLSR